MSDQQTSTTKKGGFIQLSGTQKAQVANGCCGQTIANVTFVDDKMVNVSPQTAASCCGEPVTSEVGATGCCSEPAEKQGCCG
ncbi:MAG: hypothetical protein ABI947_02365 [Chloroflexota bacterium]